MEIMQESGVDSLANLEEQITRAVHVVTELRSQNSTLTHRVAALEEQLGAAHANVNELESNNAHLSRERDDLDRQTKQQAQELDEMRGDRKQVRTRIEKLLSQLDLLSAS